MKVRLASVAVAMVLLAASAAEASLILTVTLDSPVQSATSPSFVVFNGIIVNTGTEAVTIVGDSLSAPVGVVPDLPHSDIVIGSFPLTLGPGDSFRGDWLFGVDIPATQTTSFGGTYGVLAEDSQGNPLDPFTADYRVNLAQVPEPSSLLLLGAGLLGAGVRKWKRQRT